MEVYSYLLFQNKINIAKLWKQPEEKGANRELLLKEASSSRDFDYFTASSIPISFQGNFNL